ncbi:hypothetical protein CAEBREN_07136 [Caenorhabditis brenneri]|uniref:Uncharacterized protein n=1 Tax=Caenorhabditis brenneri TaxID=135651 RepID=G0NIQ2_CAEBE|nr:hypothetical protein CAEBREN_07136 [Caenorhabditis brenneri]
MARLSVLRSTLLILFVLLNAQVDAVFFRFTGKLNCPKTFFNYKIQMLEADFSGGFSAEDMKVHEYVDSILPHHYTIEAEYNKYDELGNKYYEVFLRIRHTCTDDGKYMTKDVLGEPGNGDKGYFHWNTHTYDMTQNIDLLNAEGDAKDAYR